MTKRLLLLALVLALGLPVGCASEKAQLKKRYEAGLAEFTPMGIREVGFEKAWEKDLAFNITGKKDKVEITGVYLYGDSVLVATRELMVISFNRETGTVQWMTQISHPLAARPTVYDDVYYSVSANRLVTIDNKGKESIDRAFPTSVSQPLYVEGEYIYAAGSDGALHKMDKTTLAEIWLKPAQTEGVILAAPLMLEGMAVVGTSAGELIGVDRVVGGRRLDVRGFGAIQGIVTDGELLYFGSSDYHVYCYSPMGSELWKQVAEGQVASAPLIHAGSLFVEVLGKGITAFDLKDGNILWNEKGASHLVATDEFKVYAATEKGELWVLNGPDGKKEGALDVHEFDFAPRNTFGDGLILLAGKDGRIFCLRPVK